MPAIFGAFALANLLVLGAHEWAHGQLSSITRLAASLGGAGGASGSQKPVLAPAIVRVYTLSLGLFVASLVSDVRGQSARGSADASARRPTIVADDAVTVPHPLSGSSVPPAPFPSPHPTPAGPALH